MEGLKFYCFMCTKETTTAQEPKATAMSKFKGQSLNPQILNHIKGGNEGSNPPPETEIVIHENVGDL